MQQQQELAVAANLHIVIFAVVSLFGIFMLGLGYGQWSTRTIVLRRE